MKKAIVVAALALAVVGILGVLAFLGLDTLLRVALERFGPDLTGTRVRVERLEVSPSRGAGSIRGLELGNPPGFAERTAHMGSLSIRLDASTLTSDLVAVHELAIDSVSITYERGDRGTNLDAVQRSIEAYVKSSGAEGPQDAGKPGPGRKYVIDRLTIRKARVRMTARGLRGQGLTFDLPDVELRDVGKKQGGLTAGQVAALVGTTLQQKIAMKVLSNVDALRRGGLEGAIDALRSLVR